LSFAVSNLATSSCMSCICSAVRVCTKLSPALNEKSVFPCVFVA
jgi:hypothetical protein